MLYLFLYFVCCKLPHGKFTNSKTATETKYNTSETIGFARKVEQTPIIHYSFFIKKTGFEIYQNKFESTKPLP